MRFDKTSTTETSGQVKTIPREILSQVGCGIVADTRLPRRPVSMLAEDLMLFTVVLSIHAISVSPFPARSSCGVCSLGTRYHRNCNLTDAIQRFWSRSSTSRRYTQRVGSSDSTLSDASTALAAVITDPPQIEAKFRRRRLSRERWIWGTARHACQSFVGTRFSKSGFIIKAGFTLHKDPKRTPGHNRAGWIDTMSIFVRGGYHSRCPPND